MDTLIPPLSRRSQRSVHPLFGGPQPAVLPDLVEDPDSGVDDQSPSEPSAGELLARIQELEAWKRHHELDHSIHQNSHQLHELSHQIKEKP